MFQYLKRKDGKTRLVLLGEIKYEGIDIQKIIKENNLDPKFPYGQRMQELRKAYKGQGSYIITEAEKQEIERLHIIPTKNKAARKLGIIRNKRKMKAQEIGKASFDAPIEKCDEAQAVLDELIQREGENEKSEQL